MSEQENFATRLLQARVAKNWSQSDLAAHASVAAAQVSRYESANTAPRAHVAARLAHALGVRFEWLMSGSGQMTEDPSRLERRHEISIGLSNDLMALVEREAAQLGKSTNDYLRELVMAQVYKERDSLADELEELRGRMTAVEKAVGIERQAQKN